MSFILVCKNDFCWYCVHYLRIRLYCSDIVIIDHSWKKWVAFFLYSFKIIFIFVGHESCMNCFLIGYLLSILLLCRQRPLLSLISLTELVPMCLIRLCTRLFWLMSKLGFFNVLILMICIVMTETQRKMTLLVIWWDKFLWI